MSATVPVPRAIIRSLNISGRLSLLGISASPDRPVGFDVYELFDHNIACDIRLQTALENDLLCPFHYFGIQDLKVNGTQVDVDDFNDLTSAERVKNIIDVAEYYGHSGDRVKGLVFCSTVEEAQRLSDIFNGIEKKGSGRNYQTIALSGRDNEGRRVNRPWRDLPADSRDAIEILDYIFTVDIFNEGVDIPEINQIIMLRPTQSAIIFVQQLGRGLRKAADKEYVVVLDFIANYDKNYLIPIALSGDRTGNKDNIRRYLIEGNNVINGASTIYFDAVTRKRIFQSIDSARINTKQNIIESYQSLKRKLGRRPTLTGSTNTARWILCEYCRIWTVSRITRSGKSARITASKSHWTNLRRHSRMAESYS